MLTVVIETKTSRSRPNRRGRPRKANVRRDKAGISRGEIVDISAILSQPHRRHVKDRNAAKSELLGYPLGRLRFTNQISELQHRAGNEWALLVRAFASANGIPVSSPRSGSLLNDSGKPGYAFSGDEARSDAEEYQKRCASLRTRYNACFERLTELGRALGRDRQILIAARRVCIEERHPSDVELGDLRVGLNALAKELRIEE